MSQLSTHIINLGPSKTYGRTLVSFYILSLGFIYCTPTYLIIKTALILFLTYHYLKINKLTPCPELKALHVSMVQHHIETAKGQISPIDGLNVLLHNPIFQLLKIKNQASNQLIMIFNDQLTYTDLQYLHVKTIKTTWKKLRLHKPMLK